MAGNNPFQRLRDADRARPSFPSEHWLVFGAGVALFLYAGRSRSPLLRSIVRSAASGLIARALGGRGGVRSALR